MAGRRKKTDRTVTGVVIGRSKAKPEPLKATVIATLDCGHYLTFSRPFPKVDECLYCPKCQKEQTVKALAGEYTIRCRSCSFGRKFGTARLTAMTYASKHAIGRRHVVVVLLGEKIIHTSGPPEDQTALDDLHPPE